MGQSGTTDLVVKWWTSQKKMSHRLHHRFRESYASTNFLRLMIWKKLCRIRLPTSLKVFFSGLHNFCCVKQGICQIHFHFAYVFWKGDKSDQYFGVRVMRSHPIGLPRDLEHMSVIPSMIIGGRHLCRFRNYRRSSKWQVRTNKQDRGCNIIFSVFSSTWNV